MRSARNALLASTALLALSTVAPTANAQSTPFRAVDGFYIAGAAGLNGRLRADVSGSQFLSGLVGGYPSRGEAYAYSSPGVAALGSIGYGLGADAGLARFVRIELEASYRYNSVSKVRMFGRELTGDNGSLSNTALMLNVVRDVPELRVGITPSVTATPYIGVGFGGAFSNFNKVGGVLAVNNTTNTIDSNKLGPAAQAFTGWSWSLDSVATGLSLTTEFRYMYVQNSDQMRTTSVNRATGLSVSRVTKPNGNENLSGLIGLRYEFNVGPAARPVSASPAVAPAQPAQRPTAPVVSYLVFFEFDRADLSARARDILTEAASNIRRANVTRIEVNGHADRSGTPAYNQALSMRRAEAVAADLIARGVARDSIAIRAFGETRPLVQTADGVAEPQNRRVEIILPR